MLMLSMAVGFPESLSAYQENVTDMMFAKYQTVLKSTEDDDENVIETTTASAERFSMTSLNHETEEHNESISIYGVMPDSRYINIPSDLADNEVYISQTFSGKYGYQVGDTVTLHEKYENKSYDFLVKGIYDYSGALTVFMPNDNFNRVFEKDEDSFTGYMSDEEIEGIDENYHCLAFKYCIYLC